jgi:hypothetical protein
MLQTGLEAIGDVAVNRNTAGIRELFGFGKGSTIADYELTLQGAGDVAGGSNAGMALYGLAWAAAHEALTSGYDLTKGALNFSVGPQDFSGYFGRPVTRQYGPFMYGNQRDQYIRIYGGRQ